MKVHQILFFVGLFNWCYAQKTSKVEQILLYDGTINEVKTVVETSLDSKKDEYVGISDKFWDQIKIEVVDSAIQNFVYAVAPVYERVYSEKQMDYLINFYSNDQGKRIGGKLQELRKELAQPIGQWAQALDQIIISTIENKRNQKLTMNDVLRLERDLNNKFGLEILNLNEMIIDNEHNPGQFILDFGEISGELDEYRELVVKNNSDSLITFNRPFLLSEEFQFDGGDLPLKPQDQRTLRFTIDHRLAEGRRYSLVRLTVNGIDDSFSFGIKYSAPNKEIKYEVSFDSLQVGKSRKAIKREYVFKITNLSETQFQITEVYTNESYPSIRFDTKLLSNREEGEIGISFTKRYWSEIMKKNMRPLIVQVSLSKRKRDEPAYFPDKRLKLKLYQ